MELKRYFKIYSHYFRFSLMAAIVYRANFLVQLIVEFGYIFWLLFFIQVVYGNVSEIAGWNYLEMLFLIGCAIVFSELFVALFYVWGFRVLPEKIKNGEIDFVLVKPLHSLFALSLGRPYIASFISAIPGFYLMFYSFSHLNLALVPAKILLA
ncbi:MAG: ABC-2 family transporter protein, partial [bacterium]|nr:ABC-2 family transporter protein [bacterium]